MPGNNITFLLNSVFDHMLSTKRLYNYFILKSSSTPWLYSYDI